MRKLGRFEILGEIGRGGCGVVYKALDPKIGRHVAIKTILADAPDAGTAATARTPLSPGRTPGSPQYSLYQRLLVEAQSAGRLSHPNIVTIHELDEQDGVTFIVMEYVAGRTLSHLVEGNRVGGDTILSILRQTAEALDHAHENGVVHRDIKPANILVTPQNLVKVTDFGIAKVLQSQIALTRTGAAMGTAYYMSPEQIEARAVTPQTDQFSLAVIAFELLTGRKPFHADSWAAVIHQILNLDPPPVSAFRADLGDGVTQALRRALAKQSSGRYASCSDFVRDLSGAVLGRPVADRTLPLPPPVAPGARRWLTPVLAGAALALIAGSWLGYRLLRPAQDAPSVASSAAPSAPAAAPAPVASPPQAATKTPRAQAARAAGPAPAVAVESAPPPVPPPAEPLPQPQAPAPPPAPQVAAPPPAATPRSVAETPPPVPAPPADQRAWIEIANTRSVAALEQFRRDFPNSPYAREAAERIALLEWETVRSSNDPRALGDFLARFPSGPNAAAARDRLRALEAAAQVRDTRKLVDAALERYRQAFERRSIDELRRAWPALTRQEQSSFQEFFRNARSVTFHLRVQGDPEISGDTAIVRAIRSVQMTGERGREPAQENAVVIRLRRSGQEMLIDSVSLAR